MSDNGQKRWYIFLILIRASEENVVDYFKILFSILYLTAAKLRRKHIEMNLNEENMNNRIILS